MFFFVFLFNKWVQALLQPIINTTKKLAEPDQPFYSQCAHYQRERFTEFIYSSTSSRPAPLSDDVINTGGNSSQSSSRRCL